MKLTNRQKLHQQTAKQLITKLGTLRQKLGQTRLNQAIKKQKNVKTAASIRHQIAVIKTILNQKEMAQSA